MFDIPTPAPRGTKRKRLSASAPLLPTPQPKHPYLSGNFAPIQQTLPLTPCIYSGRIPAELADGEYIRNGSNPVSNEDLGRSAHWCDGMLAGVLFRKDESSGDVVPEFVNQFVLTDLYLSTLASPRLKVPILPSIATLVDPLASFIYVTLRIFRTLLLVLLSHLPGSKQKIKKISVANTNIVYHDGRALATCESGPPMRIQLPGLETVGWYNGAWAEGEESEKASAMAKQETTLGQDGGVIAFMREWTTAHPKIDPKTKEMLMFHSCFAPPYVQYSIIPSAPTSDVDSTPSTPKAAAALRPLPKLLNAAVPGITAAKMMHDFGVSPTHTIIMDLPLSLDPMNQMKGLPPVTYDASKPSRFGIFPRRSPEAVKWFETDASCIFHTANTWDDPTTMNGTPTGVSMLACRLTSATLVFAAGNIAPPMEKLKSVAKSAVKKRMPFFSPYTDHDSRFSESDTAFERASLLESPRPDEEKEYLLQLSRITSAEDRTRAAEAEAEALFNEDQCRLYYFHFDLNSGQITQQWALSTVPFEFPSVHPELEMQNAQYIYGCSTTTTSFGSALGKATKIDCLVKMDARTLIARGTAQPPPSVTGAVDTRSMEDVLANQEAASEPIKVFTMPEGWYAQEPRFVPCSPTPENPTPAEDDGYLLFYAFDESQLVSSTGDCPPDADRERRAQSELWIVDAKSMLEVVGRVRLPQRVPYGLHGSWVSAEQIRGQREIGSTRNVVEALEARQGGVWMGLRGWAEGLLG